MTKDKKKKPGNEKPDPPRQLKHPWNHPSSKKEVEALRAMLEKTEEKSSDEEKEDN